MSAGAPPSSPDPRSSRVIAPSDPVAMPSPPPPAPPAAAEDEKRPLTPMKMKLLFPYAVSWVFGGMNRACGMALVGLHIGIIVIRVVSFTTDPEVARFWIPIFRGWVYLCLAFLVLLACESICYYMPVCGVYAVKYNPAPQQPAAAAPAVVLLPPPPPEMDMC